MARLSTNTEENKPKTSGTARGPNPYVGGLWVKEENDKQKLSYIVKSPEDKQKLLVHLQEAIDQDKSFILFGIENSYRGDNHKAPNYVFLVPSPREDS